MISIKSLNEWLHGLARPEADRAVLGAGVDLGEIGRHRANMRLQRPQIVRWSLTDDSFRRISRKDPRNYSSAVPAVTGLRLAVETDAVPADVIQRLLRVEDVASAFVAVERPADALHPRPWHWPMRVGLVGFPNRRAAEVAAQIEAQWPWLAPLVDVRNLEAEPRAVDIALVRGPPKSALTELARVKAVANALVVLGHAGTRSPRIDSTLGMARAVTGARVSAVMQPSELPLLLSKLVTELSHARPFDVGLTNAVGREALVFAEPAAIEQAALPQIARHLADEVERVSFAAAPAPDEIAAVGNQLRIAAAGDFGHEFEEATAIAAMSEGVGPELDALVEERWCQALVGDRGDNVIRHGRNPIAFFIGPLEKDALATPDKFDDSALPWDEEDADVYRLTLVFVPGVPDAEAQQDEVHLPRFGRSTTARFDLDVDEGAAEASARVNVVFRNRILQTAVLRGRVGKTARLTNMVSLVPKLGALDDRRAFDAAIMANHTNGRSQVTVTEDGGTRVYAHAAVAEAGQRIADVLAKAATAGGKPESLKTEGARKLFIDLAKKGRDLLNLLEDPLRTFNDAARVQIVSANSAWFLPLEIAYSRRAPTADATICANYLSDPSSCNGRCAPEADRKTVCPNAFWGLSKTIERHRFDPDLDPGVQLLRLAAPQRDPTLTVTRALFGASARVGAKDRAATVRALGHQAADVAGWDEWLQSLKAAATDLLVLLPHTDSGRATLEIRDVPLERGEIEEDYVTGDREEVKPIVILFGCRTAGTKSDPAGFAARFMQKGASVVFHSTTDLKNSHATELARSLTARLAQPGDEMLSEALAAFRREALEKGYLAAFAIAAFGDADWRV